MAKEKPDKPEGPSVSRRGFLKFSSAGAAKAAIPGGTPTSSEEAREQFKKIADFTNLLESSNDDTPWGPEDYELMQVQNNQPYAFSFTVYDDENLSKLMERWMECQKNLPANMQEKLSKLKQSLPEILEIVGDNGIPYPNSTSDDENYIHNGLLVGKDGVLTRERVLETVKTFEEYVESFLKGHQKNIPPILARMEKELGISKRLVNEYMRAFPDAEPEYVEADIVHHIVNRKIPESADWTEQTMAKQVIEAEKAKRIKHAKQEELQKGLPESSLPSDTIRHHLEKFFNRPIQTKDEIYNIEVAGPSQKLCDALNHAIVLQDKDAPSLSQKELFAAKLGDAQAPIEVQATPDGYIMRLPLRHANALAAVIQEASLMERSPPVADPAQGIVKNLRAHAARMNQLADVLEPLQQGQWVEGKWATKAARNTTPSKSYLGF